MEDPEKNDLCMPTPPAKAIVVDHDKAIVPDSEQGIVVDHDMAIDPNSEQIIVIDDDLAIDPDPENVNDNYSSKEVSSNGNESPGVIDLEAQPTEPQRKRFAHFRYVLFTVYRRLFTVVFCANLAVFLYVMISDRQLLALVNATAVNLVACGLARHPMMVNAIYRVAAHYGGVHSGCGTASLVWYIGFVALLSQIYWTNSPISTQTDAEFSPAPIAVAYIILVLLFVMVVVAYPTFRRRMHDYFELTHRFTSWLILALFVALVMIFAHESSGAEQVTLGHFLVTLPAFWLLIAAIVAVAHPWLLLRRVPVKAEPLSSHAVRLSFDFKPIEFAKGVQVSKHPLRDWHSFAGFPDPIPDCEKPVARDVRGKKPFVKGHGHKRSWSIVVSKAGDWTADTIREPPTHLWKRGSLMRGVGYGLRVFDRIIIVTTGSGIGPCLGFLGDKNRPLIKVIWQTRNPVQTYGQDVIDLVHKMGPDPIIFDTSRDGRVDMLPVVRQQVKEFKAEAVFVISNPKMTQDIVYEFESQGIPAYGPIFDS
ncbi:unnamed protein product [Penicillium palitans]